MILNWILLLVIAFVAYTTGSINTQRVASRYVFHQDLTKLGSGNVWMSNFRRLFGPLGYLKLLGVEVAKDLLPLGLGALLLYFRGRADLGVAFAGFCLMMGKLWPVFNKFRGGHGCVALILIGLLIEPSVGVIAALGVIAGAWFFKSLTIGAVAGAVGMAAVAVMQVDQRLTLILTALICLLVVVQHIPGLRRVFRREEEKLSRVEDISYKFDEKF